MTPALPLGHEPLGHEPLGLELGAEGLMAEGQPTYEGSMRIGFIPFFGTMVKASSGLPWRDVAHYFPRL